MGFESDESVAAELVMHVNNTGRLHQQMVAIRKALMTKHARGQYSSEKAVKAFLNMADSGAKNYVREHGGGKWSDTFPKKIRMMAAKDLRDEFEGEAKFGNYDDLLPAKYQGKVSGKTIGESSEPAGPEIFTDEQRQGLEEAGGARTVYRDQAAQDLATVMISNSIKRLDPWLTYKTFRPALAALIAKHLEPPEGVTLR